MARPFDRPVPNDMDLLPGVAVDLLAAAAAAAAGEEDPPVDISSDEEDAGELEVGAPWLAPWLDFVPLDEDEWDEMLQQEQDEDWDEDDGDSGYESLSEEEDDEEDEEEREEDDQRFPPEEFWRGWRQEAPPAPAVDQVGRPPTPDPQQRAESPSPAFRSIQRMFEESLSSWDRRHPSPSAPHPRVPSPPILDAAPGPAPDFLPLGGSKRARDEDEEEDPSSKRQRFSDSEDRPDDPSPSTSAGTSSFTHYFHHPHLLLDPDDSDGD